MAKGDTTNKGREIRCYDYINHPYERVRAALSGDAQALFRTATKAASTRAESVASELRVNIGMLEIATDTARVLGLSDHFDVQSGNAEDLSEFPDGSFDVVCCMELFDHLPDLHKALAEMRRVLAPGGRFLYTYVPSESLYGCLGNVYRWLRARTRPSEPMLSRTYSRAAVCALLSESGLRLEHPDDRRHPEEPGDDFPEYGDLRQLPDPHERGSHRLSDRGDAAGSQR